jgi:hypothetical protein
LLLQNAEPPGRPLNVNEVAMNKVFIIEDLDKKLQFFQKRKRPLRFGRDELLSV